MRKPRAIIVDDEELILELLKRVFSRRGYDVICCDRPDFCSAYKKHKETCDMVGLCSDILITDFKMPHMTGIELLQAQSQRGCKLDNRNKAILSGYLEDINKKVIRDLGCSFFKKPTKLDEILKWADECEKRFDLSIPLDPV